MAPFVKAIINQKTLKLIFHRDFVVYLTVLTTIVLKNKQSMFVLFLWKDKQELY